MIVILVLAADGIVVLISSVCPLVDKDKRLVQTTCWRNWLRGKVGLALVGRAELSKTLIQLPADDCGYTPFLFGLRPPSTGVYRFYGRAIVDLQEDTHLPGLLLPGPFSLWRATANPCLCRRCPNTHR